MNASSVSPDPTVSNMEAAQEALRTRLYAAAKSGDVDQAKEVLFQGADVNGGKAAADGLTPLHAAVSAGHVDMVELLLAHGAHVNAARQLKKTASGLYAIPLHAYWTPLIAARKYPEVMLILLAAGANIDYQTASLGQTALHTACMMDAPRSVLFLLKHGADRTLRNFQGLTPYEVAVTANHDETVKVWDAYVAAEAAQAAIDNCGDSEVPRSL